MRIKKPIVTALFLSIFSASVYSESITEFHKRQCDAGKQESCEKYAALNEGEKHAEWIDSLGDKFSSTLQAEAMDEDDKPNLKKAYAMVLEDYFKAELSEHNKQREINVAFLEFCSSHYHNYWRNKKMIWPVDENDEADWPSIYFFIVEHYYGYCLRSQ